MLRLPVQRSNFETGKNDSTTNHTKGTKLRKSFSCGSCFSWLKEFDPNNLIATPQTKDGRSMLRPYNLWLSDRFCDLCEDSP